MKQFHNAFKNQMIRLSSVVTYYQHVKTVRKIIILIKMLHTHDSHQVHS